MHGFAIISLRKKIIKVIEYSSKQGSSFIDFEIKNTDDSRFCREKSLIGKKSDITLKVRTINIGKESRWKYSSVAFEGE